MLSQVSVEHDNNYWVNFVKSQVCRQTLAGDARMQNVNETYFTLCKEIEIELIVYF